MTIVSSRVFEDAAQKSGSRHFRYEHTDHNGQVYTGNHRLVPASFVPDLAGDALLMEEQLEEIERQKAITRVQQGEDALDVVNSFDHSTQKGLAKALIYHMVEIRDPYFALQLESLVDFIRANFTAVQIQNFLDITAGQLTTLNTKYNAFIASKTNLEIADVQEQF